MNKLKSRLNAFSDWVFDSPFWTFQIIVFVIAILRNGLWFFPTIGIFRKVSLDLTKNVLWPDAQYLYSSFLGPVLANIFRANNNSVVYAAFHFTLFTFFYFVWIFFAKRYKGDLFARLFALIFLCPPVSTTIFTWLGNSDHLVFLLGSSLLIFTNPVLLLFLGLLQGANHFTQGVFICPIYRGHLLLLSRRKGGTSFSCGDLFSSWHDPRKVGSCGLVSHARV